MAGTATRVTKAPEVRREELLDLALELCRTHGYEGMSVEQLTQAAGVAKGTFYHYFSSKADLQTQLVQRFGASLFDHLTAAAGRAEGTAAARLRVIMDAAAAYKTRHADVTQAAFLYRDENYALRHRLLAEWRERARQVLLPVIADGVADGSMRVASAEGATDIVLLLWLDAADHLWNRAAHAPDADAFAQVMINGSVSIFQAQERILGLPDGTFAMPIGPEVIHLLTELHSQLDRNQ
jgi:AcrR family transcriptional regulator